MNLEQKVEDVGLRRHNELVLYAMQIFYLDQFKEFTEMGLSPKDIEIYYISAVHSPKVEKQYQTHLDFYRKPNY